MAAPQSIGKKLGFWALKAAAWFFIVSFSWAALYIWVNPPVTSIMVKRKLTAWQTGEPAKLKRQWLSYEDISPYMILAVIATEDQNFPFHGGFDFKAISQAMEHNQKQATKKRKRIKGASTISQQVAKNVFLWEGRSWLRKGFEVYFTFLIEALWSKKRIIEVYLNVAETGNKVFGVQAAAQTYFGKTATQLNMEQAALLATVLPNPQKNNPARPSQYMINRKNWAVRQMQRLGGKNFLQALE
ncbi:monofunctional biosynthetic peptidoglycan transglycosylase [Sphingobacteriales bacterium UPWRP_1]|nr:monofunctional biosynthetic peptidoglycan transglycosylase [Sphingobacteriales bacterium TSM_CSM]PSJ72429.1 monofunctional biosynthetic peptidoglycan transglycosylase [Sphingobacteriales bacterium UPWRP_1]